MCTEEKQTDYKLNWTVIPKPYGDLLWVTPDWLIFLLYLGKSQMAKYLVFLEFNYNTAFPRVFVCCTSVYQVFEYLTGQGVIRVMPYLSHNMLGKYKSAA